ncbi:MAG: hypothetical protein COT71_02070 [Candidatus Andersenbacteria bacterium CG10_big_fil_rev_8_21_14_0_10_54_11]|uniref:Holin n=1 Tax=Candidatus Andersenbacteria bacterium CG10_big_fil_rev_8_21_14_0_10_54_11 TaxID=1974485 RepID=A0A2M6WZH9_9BACT|nr:MAG: hypothetical protein COT71_02070 [Candidatus Andersenbacteria bacterium CG10_big_fil_rev_8_21_14_0_10_54_11]
MAVTETIVTVAVVGGLVEVVKRAAKVPSHLVPLISVVTGVLLGGLYSLLPGDALLLDGIFSGLVAGLAASGTYDVVTKTGREV